MRIGRREEEEEEKERGEMEEEKCKQTKNPKAVAEAVPGQGLESLEGAQGTGSLLGQEAENDHWEGGCFGFLLFFLSLNVDLG